MIRLSYSHVISYLTSLLYCLQWFMAEQIINVKNKLPKILRKGKKVLKSLMEKTTKSTKIKQYISYE